MISTAYVNEVHEAPAKKLYVGFANMRVIAFNPSPAAYQAIFGVPPTFDLVYYGTGDDGVRWANFTFYLESCLTPNLIRTRVSYRMYEKTNGSQRTGKVQIIDRFSETTWASQDDIQNGRIPVQSNGRLARITTPYRMAYVGEEKVMSALKSIMGVPSPWKYDGGNWTLVSEDEAKKVEFSLNNVQSVFSGDFSEISEAVKQAKDRMVMCLLGIKANDSGMHQVVFPKIDSWSPAKITKEYESQLAGGWVNDYYELTEVHEFTGVPVMPPANPVQAAARQATRPAQSIQQAYAPAQAPVYQQVTPPTMDSDEGLPF